MSLLEDCFLICLLPEGCSLKRDMEWSSLILIQGGLLWVLVPWSTFALSSRDIPGTFALWLLLCRLDDFPPVLHEKASKDPHLQPVLARSNEKASCVLGQDSSMLRDVGLWRHLLEL